MHSALARITHDATIHTVVIAAAWPNFEQEIYQAADGRRMGGPEAIRQGLPAMLQVLLRSGKRVIIAEDVPSFTFSPARQMMARAFPLRHYLAQQLSPFPEMMDRADRHSAAVAPDRPEINALVRTIAGSATDTTYFPLVSQFCDSTSCRFAQHGELLYIDEAHLSVAGSRSIDWGNLIR